MLLISVAFSQQTIRFLWGVFVIIRTSIISAVWIVLKQIQKTVCRSHKVRMVSVNVCILYLHKIDDHLLCRGQAPIEHVFHNVTYSTLQLVKVN